MSSAAVVIGALRVNSICVLDLQYFKWAFRLESVPEDFSYVLLKCMPISIYLILDKVLIFSQMKKSLQLLLSSYAFY